MNHYLVLDTKTGVIYGKQGSRDAFTDLGEAEKLFTMLGDVTTLGEFQIVKLVNIGGKNAEAVSAHTGFSLDELADLGGVPED